MCRLIMTGVQEPRRRSDRADAGREQGGCVAELVFGTGDPDEIDAIFAPRAWAS